ncbi:hypothetical protein C8R47DRAFT_1228406 [Mycena vitilis]|nr:hypothetical protein C8R47DRAFT_1228406 [Mycena vitilis]
MAPTAKSFTVDERFRAGIGPYMRAPDPELRQLQRQRRLRALQRVRDAPKSNPTERATIWPFPTSPPTVDKAPDKSPVSIKKPKAAARPPCPPPFDCLRCRREIYPAKRCTCDTAKERDVLWKIADDRWYKEDRQGWFDYNAPPQRSLASLAQLEHQLEQSAQEEARRRDQRVLLGAEPGFHYLEEGGAIWLAPDDGGAAGSVMYVGDAESCVVSAPVV